LLSSAILNYLASPIRPLAPLEANFFLNISINCYSEYDIGGPSGAPLLVAFYPVAGLA
jgi:hypothetical protein